MPAPTIVVTLQSKATIVETLTGQYVSPLDSTVTTSGLDEQVILNAASTPPATLGSAFQKVMSGGAGTIDLTAVPGLTNSETIDGTGLKVQILKIRNLPTNANKITVSQGGSNPYQLDNATNWSVVLAPGQSALFYLDAAAQVIGASHKNIDLAGTASQVLEVVVVMG